VPLAWRFRVTLSVGFGGSFEGVRLGRHRWKRSVVASRVKRASPPARPQEAFATNARTVYTRFVTPAAAPHPAQPVAPRLARALRFHAKHPLPSIPLSPGRRGTTTSVR
jgi:hypothetical protein